MNIVLLSGGSGKRLWPLSNEIRSKQFIKCFKNSNGFYESMIQRVYNQIQSVDTSAKITIATSKSQVSAIQNQLKDKVDICIEPSRRDTFPALALVSYYLKDVKGLSEDETIVVCPVDPYVEQDYFESIKKLSDLAITTDSNLVLMGINPTYPSEKYGYIIPETNDLISKVLSFKEKPDKETAQVYIKNNALWNSGVFSFKLKYLLDITRDKYNLNNYKDLYINYDLLEKISFDYAVVEKEPKIDVLRFFGNWTDLGTWNTLTEAMKDKSIGNVITDDSCHNVHAINELEIPLLCMGLKDIVVAASPDGILVSDKEKSSYIKKYVESIDHQVMYAEKSWGSYKVLDISSKSITIKIILKPGEHMSYHSHKRRDEIWNIINGEGFVIIDGNEKSVNTGDIITINRNSMHTISARTVLEVIEIQVGDDIDVSDKIKHKISF